jgi:hypothetical protein
MGQVCTVCIHQHRNEMERAIVKGCNLTALAEQYSVSYDSLYNHSREHIPASLTEAFDKANLANKYNLLTEIEEIIFSAKEIFKRNKEQGRDIVALKSLSEIRSTLDLLSRTVYMYHQAKLLELELAKKEDEADNTEAERNLAEGYKHLTFAELKMWQRLQKKIIDGTDDIIIPDKPSRFTS